MKFTVNRRTWLRGELNSFLYRPTDQKSCCLGFLALKCGAVPRSIRYFKNPYQTRNVSWPKGILPQVKQDTFQSDNNFKEYVDTDLVNQIMDINDD